MQNILSKAIKYALFDPTKEMAYIPLDQESKVRVRKSVCKCVHQRNAKYLALVAILPPYCPPPRVDGVICMCKQGFICVHVYLYTHMYAGQGQWSNRERGYRLEREAIRFRTDVVTL